MRNFIVPSLLSVSLLACRPVQESPRPYAVYPQDAAYFQSVINPVDAPAEDLISLHEDRYPITLRLYEDGRFQYTLKKLGDGWGSWRHSESDGYLELYAERTLFVMEMQIRNTDPNVSEAIALEFSDRFGPKYLELKR